jgi:hypothetical protein
VQGLVVLQKLVATKALYKLKNDVPIVVLKKGLKIGKQVALHFLFS